MKVLLLNTCSILFIVLFVFDFILDFPLIFFLYLKKKSKQFCIKKFLLYCFKTRLFNLEFPTLASGFSVDR